MHECIAHTLFNVECNFRNRSDIRVSQIMTEHTLGCLKWNKLVIQEGLLLDAMVTTPGDEGVHVPLGEVVMVELLESKLGVRGRCSLPRRS